MDTASGLPLVLAICQQKGGVGKTTTTYHLACAARRLGLKTLSVDFDPQGNLSYSLVPELDPDAVTVADALSKHAGDVGLADVIVPGLWGSDVAPAGDSLAMVQDELVIAPLGRETRLREQLATVRARYDLVLIDCPPALSLLTVSALFAADVALPVVEPDPYALNGLAKLLGTIEQVRAHAGTALRMPGIVINGVQQAGGHVYVDQRAAIGEIEQAGIPVLAQIPRQSVISKARARSVALHDLPGGYPLAETYLSILRAAIAKENAA